MPSHPTYSSVAALPGVPTVCSSYGELCGLSGSSANAISGAGGLSVTLQQHLTMIIPSYTAAVMLTSITHVIIHKILDSPNMYRNLTL